MYEDMDEVEIIAKIREQIANGTLPRSLLVNEMRSFMDPNAYQSLAMRTLCDQEAARERLAFSEDVTMANHAIIGLAGEVGELASLWQKLIYYGKQMTLEEVRQKIKDEAGDVLWYVAELLTSHGLSMSDVMQANIDKLRVRYPDKYSDQQAADENRDRAAEDRAMVSTEMTGEEGGITFVPGVLTPVQHPFEINLNKTPHPSHKIGELKAPHSGRYCMRCGALEGMMFFPRPCRGRQTPEGHEGMPEEKIIQDGHGFGHKGGIL